MARHVINNTPNTISTKQVVHFGQLLKSGKFQRFDYKSSANLRIYGQAEPPAYNIRNVTTNMFVYYGVKDFLTTVKVNLCNLGNFKYYFSISFIRASNI